MMTTRQRTVLILGVLVTALAPFPTGMLPLTARAAAQQAGPGVPASVAVPQTRAGWLGLSYDLRWVQRDRACEPRVLVESVVEGAPADRAGLRKGDRILAVDGRTVARDALPFSGHALQPGDSVRLRVARAGGAREIVAVADLRPGRPPLTLVRPDGFSASDAPVVLVDGDSLVARNVERHHVWGGGYWLARGDGRADYRRLDRFGGGEVDRRVAELLRCVAESRVTTPVQPSPPPLEQLHRRADSLRVVIARRAMAREVPEVVFEHDGMLTAASAPRVQVYRFEAGDGAGAPAAGVVAGAEVTSLERELAEYFRGAREGLLVLRVATGSAADRAGLRPGDVITGAGGRRVQSVDGLRQLLSRPDGARIELRVVRHGRTRLVTLGGG